MTLSLGGLFSHILSIQQLCPFLRLTHLIKLTNAIRLPSFTHKETIRQVKKLFK